jgi:hypothetical protein
MRRKLVLFGVPIALVIAFAAWKLAFQPPPAVLPVESVASSTASASNAAQLAEPPAPPVERSSPLPAVLPPLSTRSATPASEPPRPSNTVPAPTDTVNAAAEVAAPPAPAPMVRVTFAIAPWGEVYIDGRRRGVAPPLTEISLPPGTYAVEVRNTTFAPMRRTIEVGIDSAIRIKHKFN